MKSKFLCLAAVLAAAGLLLVGCTPAAPTPAPTQAPVAPAAPAKVAEPTTAPAAQPTAAPAVKAPTAAVAKVDYPQKGKVITLVVPFAPGGSNSILGLQLAPLMEKELGTTINVVNKAGAGTVLGLMDVVNARPDGYTLGLTSIATTILRTVDPDVEAPALKDFTPVAVATTSGQALSVRADSPYKTTKELIEAAKAKPRTLKVGTSGLLAPTHIASLLLQRAAGVKFADVHFEGGGESIAALLGGHLDAVVGGSAQALPLYRGGEVLVLGYAAPHELGSMPPEIKTFVAQGYDASFLLNRGVYGPAGMPKEIVDILAGVIKKVTENPEFQKQVEEGGMEITYLGPEEFRADWAKSEKELEPMMLELKKELATK